MSRKSRRYREWWNSRLKEEPPIKGGTRPEMRYTDDALMKAFVRIAKEMKNRNLITEFAGYFQDNGLGIISIKTSDVHLKKFADIVNEIKSNR